MLVACALSGGCLAQPGDVLIGQWEGRAEQQDAQQQAGQDADDKPNDGASEESGRVTPASTGSEPSGRSSAVADESDSALKTVQPPSLLDPFDFAIRLHFEDRQNVQMTFQAGDRQESLRGTWSIVGRTGEALNLEILPAQSNTSGKVDAAAGADSSKGKKPSARRFKIVFSPTDNDRFTLTEVDTGRQQGSIVFRRHEAN